MFDGIALGYDRLNRWMSLGQDRRWRRALVRALAPTPGSRWLDVATGTGDVVWSLATACSGCSVVGVDTSEGMLRVGRAKLAAAGLDSRVSLMPGDARALPFPDGAFDGAAIAFGIRNVPDRQRALAELARVVRPRGRVAVLELTAPRRGPLAPLARLHIHGIVPRIGTWLSGDPAYRYLSRSIAAFPAPEAFADLMCAAGLIEVTVTSLTMGVCHLFTAVVPDKGAERR